MDSFIPPSKGRPTCSRTGLEDVEKLCSSSSGTDDTDENDHKTYLTRKLQHFLLKQVIDSTFFPTVTERVLRYFVHATISPFRLT